MLRLDVETDGLTLLKQWTDPKLYQRAAKAGLKTAARGVKTLAGKEISARYNLKSSRVKNDIRGPRFIAGDFAVEFSFARKAPTLTGGYGFADRGKGLTGRIFRGGAATRVTRGFQIASERGSAFALGWRRVNRKGRLPIEVVHGPSIGSIALGEGRFADDLQQAMGERAMEQYVKGAEHYLSRFASSSSATGGGSGISHNYKFG